MGKKAADSAPQEKKASESAPRAKVNARLLRELSAVIHDQKKLLSLGTYRGDYIGFPLGNMKLEWRKWIQERIIDELHLDERGWAWGRHGYGYLRMWRPTGGWSPSRKWCVNAMVLFAASTASSFTFSLH